MLTQGDRNATVGAKTMSLSDFNFDNKYGKDALDRMRGLITTLDRSPLVPELSDDLIDDVYDEVRGELSKHSRIQGALLNQNPDEFQCMPDTVFEKKSMLFSLGAYFWMRKLCLDEGSVPRFLGRLLGLQVAKQNVLFTVNNYQKPFLTRLELIFYVLTQFFVDLLEDLVRAAKQDGKYDMGIAELKGMRVYMDKPPQTVYTDPETPFITL